VPINQTSTTLQNCTGITGLSINFTSAANSTQSQTASPLPFSINMLGATYLCVRNQSQNSTSAHSGWICSPQAPQSAGVQTGQAPQTLQSCHLSLGDFMAFATENAYKS